MRHIIVLCVWLLVASVMAFGDYNTIDDVSTKVFFTGQVVGTSASVTSSEFMQAVGKSNAQTIQWTTSSTGGTTSLALVVLESLDSVGFYQPTVGGTITTVTDDVGGICQMSAPMCKAIKIKIVNLSASATTTVNVTVCSQ